MKTIGMAMAKVVSCDPYLILDVGIGMGKWGLILKNYGFLGEVDGLEINEEIVNEYLGKDIYSNVILGDLRDFIYDEYDMVIFGDTLSYLSREDAVAAWESATESCPFVIMTMPLVSDPLYVDDAETRNIDFAKYMKDQVVWTTEEILASFKGIDMHQDFSDCGIFFCDSRIGV